ncbi:hypothetical protein WA158_007070 [Blastocystis sp. Blastoise]
MYRLNLYVSPQFRYSVLEADTSIPSLYPSTAVILDYSVINQFFSLSSSIQSQIATSLKVSVDTIFAGSCSTGEYEVILERQYASNSGEVVKIASAESSFLRNNNVFRDESVATQDSKVEYKVCIDGKKDYNLELSSTDSKAWSKDSFVTLTYNKKNIAKSSLEEADNGKKVIKFNLSLESISSLSKTIPKYTQMDSSEKKSRRLDATEVCVNIRRVTTDSASNELVTITSEDGTVIGSITQTDNRDELIEKCGPVGIWQFTLSSTNNNIWQSGSYLTVSVIDNNNESVIVSKMKTLKTSTEIYYINTEYSLSMNSSWKTNSYNTMPTEWYSLDDSNWNAITYPSPISPSSSQRYFVFRKTIPTPSIKNQKGFILSYKTLSNTKIYINNHELVTYGFKDGYTESNESSTIIEQTTTGPLFLFDNQSTITISVIIFDSQHSINISFYGSLLIIVDKHDDILRNKDKFEYNDEISKNRKLSDETINKEYADSAAMPIVYSYDNITPPKHWSTNLFNDDLWSTVSSSSSLPDVPNDSITQYYRIHYTIETPLSFYYRLDIYASTYAGMIIYMNGVEIRRVNMNDGDNVEYNTLATAEYNEYKSFRSVVGAFIDRRIHFVGDNIIAIEIHRYNTIIQPNNGLSVTIGFTDPNVPSIAGSWSANGDVDPNYPLSNLYDYDKNTYTKVLNKCSNTIFTYTYNDDICVNLNDLYIYYQHDLSESYSPESIVIEGAYNNGGQWNEVFSKDELNKNVKYYEKLNVNKCYNTYRMRITKCGTDSSIPESERESMIVLNELDLYVLNYGCVDKEWSTASMDQYAYKICPKGYTSNAKRLCMDNVLLSIEGDPTCIKMNPSELFFEQTNIIIKKNNFYEQYYTIDAVDTVITSSPTLPEGIMIDSESQRIYGTPTSESSPTTYTLSYTNDEGVIVTLSQISIIVTDSSCFPDNNWPKTNLESTVSLPCPTGYSGSISRYCNSDCLWEEPDLSECIFSSTPCTGTTYYNGSQCVECENGITSSLNGNNYICTPCEEGTYVYKNKCFNHLYCEADGNWPQTNPETTAKKSCPFLYKGDITRYCNDNMIWEEEDNSNCVELPPCTGTTYLSGTECVECDGIVTVENGKNIACTPCEEGTYAYNNKCFNHLYCEADGNWPQTNPETTAKKSCPFLYKGDITRYCNDNMIWEEENSNSCIKLPPCTGNTYLSGTQCVECINGEIITENGYNIACTPCGDDEHMYNGKCLSNTIVCPATTSGFVDLPETKVGRKAAIQCSNDAKFGYYYVSCDYISGVPTWSNDIDKRNCYPRPSVESGKGLQLLDYTFNLNACLDDITDIIIPYARTFIHTYPYELTDLKMATNYDENKCHTLPLQVYYGTNTEIYDSATYKQKLFIKHVAASTSNIQESSSSLDDRKCYLYDSESGCQHLQEGYQIIPTNSYHSDTYFCKQHQLKYTSMPVRSFDISNTNIYILGITIDKMENSWVDPENIAAVYKSIIASIDLPLKQLQLIDTTSNTLSKLLSFSFYIAFPEQIEINSDTLDTHIEISKLKEQIKTILTFENSEIMTQLLHYKSI